MGCIILGSCTCQPGFMGDKCEFACKPGTYGRYCKEICDCKWDNTDSCNPVTGECRCKEGWNGNVLYLSTIP